MKLSLIESKPKRKPVVAIDLDGTVAKESDFDSKKIGPPIYNAKEILEKVRELGVTIVINTCRDDEKLIKSWFREHHIPYDHINVNPDQPKDTSSKIMADRYWDNRQPSWRGLQYAYEELQRYLDR